MGREDDKGKRVAYLTQSPSLFAIAVEACEQAEANPGKPSWDRIRAIIFAAISLEAFVNELVEHAAMMLRGGACCPSAERLVSILRHTEAEKQTNVRLKYQVAMTALKGEPYATGSPPFDDYDLLARIRNELVHSRPGTVIRRRRNGTTYASYPANIKAIHRRLRARGLLAPPRARLSKDWADAFKSPNIERWACQTAASMVASAIDAIPDQKFRKAVARSSHTFAAFAARKTG